MTQLRPCHLVDRHLAKTFDINKTMSICWQTFHWHNIWLKELLPCHLFYRHLANAMFGWNSYYHVIRLKDIWLTIFGWHRYDHSIWLTNIWLTQCLTQQRLCHLVNRHLTDTILGLYRYNHVIWMTQCLFDTIKS